ncbi:UTP:RNA uridylyltransferase 1 [Cornus florida]|uniref:UTP:RNA uridylyltransferase 1 n=1 Tax=Cornus florida TaxID=4283 RepID=UPI0028996372|nr:UTP:RNA uridylyltransferase 1 [Cornus florida]
MKGGGGEASPSTPGNGGDFLLQLLRNPPQMPPPRPSTATGASPSPPPPPPPTFTHDPAVAAVGPSLPFPPYQSNGQDLPYPPPHNFFLRGLAQNPNPKPNPNPNWSSPPPPGFNNAHHQQPLQLNQQVFGDDLRKLGFSGMNPRPMVANQQEHNLIFGSLPCQIRNNDNVWNVNSANIEGLISKEREMGSRNKRLNGLEFEFQNPLDFNRNPQGHQFQNHEQQHGLNYRSMAPEVRQPPPGFASKLKGVGNWESGNRSSSFEHNVNKERGQLGELNHASGTSNIKDVRERRLPEYGLGPGLPAGSNLHSVSVSDIEESMLKLHGEAGEKPGYGRQSQGMTRRDDDRGRLESDDYGEQLIGSLVQEDESDDKNGKRKHQNSRDKDYRSDTRGQRMLGQRTRNFKRLIECRTDIHRLNAPFLAIYESLIPPEEEKAKQKQLLTVLEKLVNKEWPEARLYLYGSCANSFGVSKSDIDVCLAIEDADINKSDVLLKLADALQSDNLQNVQALTRARVPIVKLMDPVTGISCDICINNVLAVVNTKLLQNYAQIDERLRQLAFIVKHWAKARAVNETYRGTLSSYAYVLMCIHFLQQCKPAILPCLQEMERTYVVTVENVECAYFDQVEKLRNFGCRNRESIAQLVWAFFNYWAYIHDYTNDVISVRTGSILSKRAKDWTRRIGNERHLICIEDPFEISHDLGRVVDKFSIRVLREEFERAAEIMQYDPNPCVTLFEPYFHN